MKKPKWYTVIVTPIDESQEEYDFKVETSDIEWTMEQYMRNREGFAWRIKT